MNPKLAITMGDPSGIGPEIIAKLFADQKQVPATVVVGDAEILDNTIRRLALPLSVRRITRVTDSANHPGQVPVLAVGELPSDLPTGRVDARSGRAAFNYVRTAIDLAMRKEINAIVTAPLSFISFSSKAPSLPMPLSRTPIA